MRRLLASSLLLLTMLVLAPVAEVAMATPYEIVTFNMSGRTVKQNGTPKPNTLVSLRLIHATTPPNINWTSVSVTSDANGNFSKSVTTNGYYAVASINAQAYQGIAKTLTVSYPVSGLYNFGDLISGNCRSCPLPEDGSNP